MNKIAIKGLTAVFAAGLSLGAWAWNDGGEEQQKALSLTPDVVRGMEIYDACVACHLAEGWGEADGTVPQLAGQHRSVLIKQLADIRSGKRDDPAASAYPFALPAAIFDEQALADVAAYMEILPMNPDWGKGPWGPASSEYAHGQRIYEDGCLECHGETGMGEAERLVPRINGQHHDYMLHQLEWIRDGKRRDVPDDMVEHLRALSDKDLQLVIDYVSWQQVPKEQLAEL
jgi:cytochrome c553